MNSTSSLLSSVEDSVLLLRFSNYLLQKVSGLDAARYLQARTTQDVLSLKGERATLALLLSPQGKTEAEATIVADSNGFLLISEGLKDRLSEEAFVSSLLRFKVADQFENESLSREFSFLSLIGGKSRELLLSLDLALSKDFRGLFVQTSCSGIPLRVIQSLRAGTKCFDILVATNQLEELLTLFSKNQKGINLLEISEGDYELLRIRAGEPRWGAEITPSIFAAELGLSTHLSFSKGCYPGQEAVEMSIARGRTNRTLVQLSATISSPAPPPDVQEGCLIYGTQEREKSCGIVTSSAFSPEEGRLFCLGFIKRSALDRESRFNSQGITLVVEKQF